MIIICINCSKQFDVDPDLIPEEGRLLECNGCNHRWFFNKKIITEPVAPIKIKSPTEDFIEPVNIENSTVKTDIALGSETIELLDSSIKSDFVKFKGFTKKKGKKNTVKKNYNILALTIVFIISFIAMVIIADTFKSPIGKIVPNLEFLLYNLYETINDIKLFLIDLI